MEKSGFAELLPHGCTEWIGVKGSWPLSSAPSRTSVHNFLKFWCPTSCLTLTQPRSYSSMMRTINPSSPSDYSRIRPLSPCSPRRRSPKCSPRDRRSPPTETITIFVLIEDRNGMTACMTAKTACGGTGYESAIHSVHESVSVQWRCRTGRKLTLIRYSTWPFFVLLSRMASTMYSGSLSDPLLSLAALLLLDVLLPILSDLKKKWNEKWRKKW